MSVGLRFVPKKHPEDPAGYYGFLEGKEVCELAQPVPGYRFHGVRADGSLFGFPAGGTTTDRALCGGNAAKPWQRAFLPPAPEHDPECGRCGIRVVADLETLVTYMHFLGTHKQFEDPHNPRGPVALAVIDCTGSGYAAPIPEWRKFNGDDPEHCLRVSQAHMGQRMFLAQAWADGTPVPADIEEKVQAQYPNLTIVRVPTIYEIPGTTFPGLPTPGGETYHPGGRFGRYGGAGALLQHSGKFLIVRRRDNGLWTVPGGALSYADEDPWETARREMHEETGRIYDMTPRGNVTYRENGWTFRTFAADVTDPWQPHTGNREILAAEWATAEDLQEMRLMPEFRAVLPELLALFN